MLLKVYLIWNLHLHKSTRLEDSENICKVFGKLRLRKLEFDDSEEKVERKIQENVCLLGQVFIILHQSQQS